MEILFVYEALSLREELLVFAAVAIHRLPKSMWGSAVA
jgi:hypothetical protein